MCPFARIYFPITPNAADSFLPLTNSVYFDLKKELSLANPSSFPLYETSFIPTIYRHQVALRSAVSLLQ